MFWRKKKNREDRMPWYRRRDYMTSAPYPARARYEPSVRTPDILCFWRLLPTSLLALVLMTVSQIPTWTAEAGNASKCDRSRFRVVVDVGHTVQAPGALSARNVPEYDFNLRLGQQIQQRLIADRFTGTVLLVTEGGARPSLFKRVATANELPADLFLSIHHDSVPDWLLEDWEFEGTPNHFSDRFSGYSLFVSRDNPDYDASLLFATLLGKQLKGRGLQYARQYTGAFMGKYQHELVDADLGIYRYDQLIVLKEAKMPSVLLEAGSIINRDEELQMNSPERRDLITASVIKAVEAFCNVRSGDHADAHRYR
jgi:N-acetylmuramoyl-L-alanine amidase